MNKVSQNFSNTKNIVNSTGKVNKIILENNSFISKKIRETEDLQSLSHQFLLEIFNELNGKNKKLRENADYYINLSSQLGEEVILLRNQVDKFKHSSFNVKKYINCIIDR